MHEIYCQWFATLPIFLLGTLSRKTSKFFICNETKPTIEWFRHGLAAWCWSWGTPIGLQWADQPIALYLAHAGSESTNSSSLSLSSVLGPILFLWDKHFIVIAKQETVPLGADCGQTSALNQSPSACWVTPATGLAVGCRAAGLWDVISPFTTPQSDGQQRTEKCQTCTKSFPHFRGKHCIRGKRSSHHFHVCWQPRPPLPSFSPCVEFYC